MKISHYVTDKEVVVVTPLGCLDGLSAGHFLDTLSELISMHPKVALDCSGIVHMDSMGMGILMVCLRQALSLRGDIRIGAPVPVVSLMLELTRADKVFGIFETAASAAASFDTDLPAESVSDCSYDDGWRLRSKQGNGGGK